MSQSENDGGESRRARGKQLGTIEMAKKIEKPKAVNGDGKKPKKTRLFFDLTPCELAEVDELLSAEIRRSQFSRATRTSILRGLVKSALERVKAERKDETERKEE